MATIFHDIFNEIKAIEGAEDLMYPVNAKKVPDYYEIVKKPMDLQQVRKNIAENRYDLRRQLIEDLMQILNNSRAYNGATHEITQAAQKIFDLATRKMQENELKLIQLEKTINPLLDDDDMVGFAHILTGIVHECKNLPKSAAFHSKVDAKKVSLLLH
jgi:transcription initiation factor TFIID subunit 1